jgi:hypothetical protein
MSRADRVAAARLRAASRRRFDHLETGRLYCSQLRRSTMRAYVLPVLAALCLAAAATAQPARVLLADVACINESGHTLVQGAAAPLPAGGEVRFYFRRQGHGDFYWVPGQSTDQQGVFWGVLPVPEPDNDVAEVYAALYGPTGMPLAQSRVRSVPVRGDCPVELDERQQAESRAMTVGETTLGQKLRKLAWWRCDGLRTRIDVRGERRDDDTCLPLAWWQRPEALTPFVLIAGGGITTVVVDPEPPPELSAVNP